MKRSPDRPDTSDTSDTSDTPDMPDEGSNTKQRLYEYLEILSAYRLAMNTINWDQSVCGAPAAGVSFRSKGYGVLTREHYRYLMAPEFRTLLNEFSLEPDSLEGDIAREWLVELARIEKIPKDEYTAFMTYISKSEAEWEEAKRSGDFDSCKQHYQFIFDTARKFSEYIGYEKHPYDAWIEMFEPGMTVEKLDHFFGQLRDEIVPLLAAIREKLTSSPERYGFLSRTVPREKQKRFAKRLLEVSGFDLSRGFLGESEHPFTNAMSIDDVRMTTHYYENEFVSAIFSVLHEGGHGIYEQNFERELANTGLDNGSSSAVHESQARMFENAFGRSSSFWSGLYGEMKESFSPALDDISLDAFVEAINRVEPTLIRIEADELTYPLHIMVRYELEKAIFEGALEVEALPEAWDRLMRAYLGVVPAHHGEGVLQDVHWAAGLIGYFPSYALGNAYASQLLHFMGQEVDIDRSLRTLDFGEILEWLKFRVHAHGKRLKPEQVILEATGEAFDPRYYIQDLKSKYEKRYGLR
ncbi:carboxypeptidase M32 [Acidaminobacter hydrogenoformans]|uniref:Metal-dependent carboxypeptidase n=1 Tax=Acidaminobacter hydrogenoformans DSM 2784 TaxID=1120920 RepID=A0A1G5S393_9FIRM|nr:carboxypeptidase M32 [Acidaminobacter hydrogenoformans]SCZ80834.1 carboxypeptidase Taq [Acidaminobacter hydrogenoformans DSM 2784]